MNSLTRPTPRKLGFLLLALSLCAGSSGCLGFEKQTIVLFFPQDGEIHALFVYEGLLVIPRSDKKEPKHLDAAIEDLEELMRGDAVIFGDPLFRVPLKLRPKETLSKSETRYFNLFKSHVTAHKGMLLTHDNGKLTYCQPVTVRAPQKLAASFNKLTSEGILGEKDGPPGMEKETFELFKKFARNDHAWTRFDKGRFSVSFPGTPAFFQQVRQGVFDPAIFDNILLDIDLLEKADPNNKVIVDGLRQQTKFAQSILRSLATAPISVEQRRNTLTLSLGYGDNEAFALLTPFERKAENPKLDMELKTHAKTLGVPVRTDVSVENVVSQFQRTGQLPKPRKD